MFDWLVDHFATDSASTHFAVANTNRMRIGYYGIACADPIIRTDLDWLSIELLTAGTEPSREHSVLAMTWDPNTCGLSHRRVLNLQSGHRRLLFRLARGIMPQQRASFFR